MKHPKRIKEERTGVTKKAAQKICFTCQLQKAILVFYNNLVNIPSISQTPFISPVSYSGLLAYRYKTVKTEIKNGKKIYTVSIKPRQLSNATVEGEIVIADSSWIILHTRLQFPSYHLASYGFWSGTAVRKRLTEKHGWSAASSLLIKQGLKRKLSGRTIVSYRGFWTE